MDEKNTQENQTSDGDRRGAGADKLCYVLESVPKNEILHLTLKKKWFDMISSGQKEEEYREIKPYWNKRLKGIHERIKYILFKNGYAKNSPKCLVAFSGLTTGYPKSEWSGEIPDKRVYILNLGKVIYTDSCT